MQKCDLLLEIMYFKFRDLVNYTLIRTLLSEIIYLSSKKYSNTYLKYYFFLLKNLHNLLKYNLKKYIT